jgi:uncharacterized membrane protein YccC
MTYDAVAFLNSSLAILVGIAVAVVLFATFFPETPAFAVRRFRRQIAVHLSYLAGASQCASALPCYQRALCEQLGETLARVKDEAKAGRESFASAVTALSAAQAISRLGESLTEPTLPPSIAREGSRLLARLSRTLRHPSIRNFGKTAAEAHALGRHALMAARGSAQADDLKALDGIIVGAETLGSDLIRAPMVLQGNNAIAI